MDSLRPHNNKAYAVQEPVEETRPQLNIKGDDIVSRHNNNLKNLKVVTPENKETKKPENLGTFVANTFWVDDNEMQNPVKKLVNNIGKKNSAFKTSLIRDNPHQEPLLDERNVFKFSQKQDVVDGKRPSAFNGFFNR